MDQNIRIYIYKIFFSTFCDLLQPKAPYQPMKLEHLDNKI